MNSPEITSWESRLDRELKALPPQPAPATLIPRVMAVVARQAGLPWYRRPWPTWPLGLRVASLAGALTAFGGLCYGSAQPLPAGLQAALSSVAGKLGILEALGHTALALLAALGHALQGLGPGMLALGLGWLVLCYVVGVGLTTLCARLAFASSRAQGKT